MLDRLKSFLPARFRSDRPVVPVVRLSGAIGIGTPFRPALTLAAVAEPLERAFSVKKAPAVALIIDSPGGSPVQSHLIFQRIRKLAAEKEKPVIAYVEDVAASGGYMIAVAADEIVADPSSIVGSIGVVSAGFGFDQWIARHGIERRVYTAGTRKAVLDPFRPENPDDVEHLKSLQRSVHRHFVDLVKARRGPLLTESEDLFSGLFWAGEEARGLGLVDRLGSLAGDLEMRFGKGTRPRVIQPRRGMWRRSASGIGVLTGQGGLPALISADEAVTALEVRALYSRYGL